MLKMPFAFADLGLAPYRERTRRSSVSGVQDKVQLRRCHGVFDVVDRDGDYILKLVPRSVSMHFAYDVPANEALTMDIAAKAFHIQVAEHALVALADGEPAYLTKRFDRRADGGQIPQEDFCQLARRSPDTHGENYKYNASYEELAGFMRHFCPAHAVENPKVFFLILFNYVFSNGDAHLKNFSLFQGPQGDAILTPAYDLLDTAIHFPNETATALEFFADGHFSAAYETLGFHSSADFVELGTCFGVPEADVRDFIARFSARRSAVERLVAASTLSLEAKDLYIAHFTDRLRALAQ